jgi:hypothetical protein
MRYIPICLSAILILALACSKDKVETRPSIKVDKLSATEIPVGGDLSIDLDFTDKEGDLHSIFVQKLRINKKVVPTIRDTFSISIAEFPKNDQGSLQINLFYQNQLISAQPPPTLPGSPTGFESDSLVFRLALRDKSNNVSDTINTETVVVQRKN